MALKAQLLEATSRLSSALASFLRMYARAFRVDFYIPPVVDYTKGGGRGRGSIATVITLCICVSESIFDTVETEYLKLTALSRP